MRTLFVVIALAVMASGCVVTMGGSASRSARSETRTTHVTRTEAAPSPAENPTPRPMTPANPTVVPPQGQSQTHSAPPSRATMQARWGANPVSQPSGNNSEESNQPAVETPGRYRAVPVHTEIQRRPMSRLKQ